jgi:hypothetical protein
MGTLTRTGTGLAIAQKVYSAACWIATAAQNALNISYGTFLALTGVGIAVIVAAAAAMWSFSSSMNSATDSVKNFNTNATEIPQRTRNIQRSTENPSTSASTLEKLQCTEGELSDERTPIALSCHSFRLIHASPRRRRRALSTFGMQQRSVQLRNQTC